MRLNKKHRDELFGRVLKFKDAKLEDVLVQSQCSEISWDHMVEVLQDDLMMMADLTLNRMIKENLLNDEIKLGKWEESGM